MCPRLPSVPLGGGGEAARSERRALRQRREGGKGGEAGPGRRREARRRLRQRTAAAAAAARRAWTGRPELGWAAGEEEPQELQLCQLGPSLETSAWLVPASRRWEGAGMEGAGLPASG